MRDFDPNEIIGQTVEGKAVTWAEIEHAVAELKKWLTVKLTTGACAKGLIFQLAGHYCRMPQQFRTRRLLADVHAVLDQIALMENSPMVRGIATKAAEPLRGGLKGLWHKHWFQAAFIATNLLNEMDKNGEMLLRKFLNAKFGREGWQGQLLTRRLAGELANVSSEGALSHRAGKDRQKSSRLTGEWIVYAKTPKRNIYLALAGHSETDADILERCRYAPTEFPELQNKAPFSDFEK
ncbi:MAG: hypothetical protein JSR78_05330 [Proteobacteria bacterium]|nr:hypothetical protein [Pseudomonadota bacterium]